MAITIDDEKNGQADDSKDVKEKDISKFTDEQKDDYIEKLKDENARRRIANKKAQDILDKQKNEQDDAKTLLESTQKKLKELESAEEKLKLKDKSENEKLAAKITALETMVTESKQNMDKLAKDLSVKERKIKKQDREVLVDRLVHKMGADFSSDYERDGFTRSLLTNQDDGSFALNDEEVILKIKGFVKDKKKAPDTPGAGPSGRSPEAPLAEEIKGLLAKKSLTDKDGKRLDELLEEVEKQQ